MLIDTREIERVKRANELVGLIRSRGVSLTQRGKQFVGLCPMHPDTEPSLIIDPKKQLWNCSGACHEGGDVYRFVMKADGVDFREAHRRLGGHETAAKSVAVEDQQWLERAVDHYHARLLETPAAGLPALAGHHGNGVCDELSSWLCRRDLGAEAAGGRTQSVATHWSADRLGA
jgi:DNA primase